MNQEREEKRLSYKLITYWKKIKDTGGLPDIRQFNHTAIGPVWDSCMRVVVSEKGRVRTYTYEYIGPKIIEAYGKDLTGQRVSPSIRTIPGANIIRKLDASIPMQEPVMEQGQMINNDNKMIKYRSCILPFGNREYDISHVIIGLSWKIF